MRWKLVGLVPRDGMEVKAGDITLTLRGSIGKATVVALPNALFYREDFKEISERARDVAQQTTGLQDVLVVEEGVEFLRLVPEGLGELIDEAIGGCESCCLDNEEDRTRLRQALLDRLTQS